MKCEERQKNRKIGEDYFLGRPKRNLNNGKINQSKKKIYWTVSKCRLKYDF